MLNKISNTHTHIPVLYLFAALPPDNEKGNSKLYDGLYRQSIWEYKYR